MKWLLDDAGVRKERAQYVPLAKGVVLEVGAGSGANIPYYSLDVTKLIALEPSQDMWNSGEQQQQISEHFPVEYLCASAEHIPLPDESVDAVVSTWTLCSIPHVEAALGEIRRVLKPGGNFIFVEHGRSPNVRVARYQKWLTPFWKKIAGGCHLNRKIDELITQAGFTIVSLDTDHKNVLQTLGCAYGGTLVKINNSEIII